MRPHIMRSAVATCRVCECVRVLCDPCPALFTRLVGYSRCQSSLLLPLLLLGQPTDEPSILLDSPERFKKYLRCGDTRCVTLSGTLNLPPSKLRCRVVAEKLGRTVNGSNQVRGGRLRSARTRAAVIAHMHRGSQGFQRRGFTHLESNFAKFSKLPCPILLLPVCTIFFKASSHDVVPSLPVCLHGLRLPSARAPPPQHTAAPAAVPLPRWPITGPGRRAVRTPIARKVAAVSPTTRRRGRRGRQGRHGQQGRGVHPNCITLLFFDNAASQEAASSGCLLPAGRRTSACAPHGGPRGLNEIASGSTC